MWLYVYLLDRVMLFLENRNDLPLPEVLMKHE